jgi:hypothetical protein
MKTNLRNIVLRSLIVTLVMPLTVYSQTRNETSPVPVMWRDPGIIATRDLRYGSGGPHLIPTAPFTFIREDKSGESPKFEVKDAKGVTWMVKLGEEAQAETVATRLVWAVGYFAEEAYYFPSVRIRRLPELSRGMEHVGRGSLVHGARFEPRRSHIERGDTWDWNDNHFRNTQELNGLKILMILLNNYDARKENNRILHVTDKDSAVTEAWHVVTDLGASLGRAGGLGGKRSKNSLKDFLSTRFVRGVHEDGSVQFDYDTRPRGLGHFSILYLPYYRGEVKKEKAMRGIPVEHARWIGSLLSQVSDEQLRDAFDAAGYNRTITDGYVRALRERINQLGKL